MKPVVGTNQIGTANRDPGPVRRDLTLHLRPILQTSDDHVGRNDTFRNDLTLAVNIAEELIDRIQLLPQAPPQHLPIGVREQSWNAVNRNDAFVGLRIAVDGEVDALGQK